VDPGWPNESPYLYAVDNPVSYVDRSGLNVSYSENASGPVDGGEDYQVFSDTSPCGSQIKIPKTITVPMPPHVPCEVTVSKHSPTDLKTCNKKCAGKGGIIGYGPHIYIRCTGPHKFYFSGPFCLCGDQICEKACSIGLCKELLLKGKLCDIFCKAFCKIAGE
jgi:hypothetical protein